MLDTLMAKFPQYKKALMLTIERSEFEDGIIKHAFSIYRDTEAGTWMC